MERKYRMQVWNEGRWRWGVNDYTWDEAVERQEQLTKVGIKARIRHRAELFS